MTNGLGYRTLEQVFKIISISHHRVFETILVSLLYQYILLKTAFVMTFMPYIAAKKWFYFCIFEK